MSDHSNERPAPDAPGAGRSSTEGARAVADDTRELWDTDQVAAHLGVQPGSARGTLSRLGVAAVDHRQVPGGRVRAYYDAAQVRAAHDARPGRGARTDRTRRLAAD